MSQSFRSRCLLLIVAFIWGSAFIAQKSAETLGIFSFNGPRTLLGGLVLIPIIYKKIKLNKKVIVGGISCGIILFVASTLQTAGITYTTVGKAGFITSLYTIFVPFISILLRKKVKFTIWFSLPLSISGLYLLTMTESFSLQKGDFLVLLSAFMFAIHIIIIDIFSDCDSLSLSCFQFLTAGIIGCLCMFIFESPTPQLFINHPLPYIYGGLLSTGLAYSLQVVAQKNVPPSEASLILSLESVFSSLCGMVILNESMSIIQLVGCLLILIASILSQISIPIQKESVSN